MTPSSARVLGLVLCANGCRRPASVALAERGRVLRLCVECWKRIRRTAISGGQQ